jgi:hypothetical protein
MIEIYNLIIIINTIQIRHMNTNFYPYGNVFEQVNLVKTITYLLPGTTKNDANSL